MIWYNSVLYVHIIASILVVGLALYWVIMVASLARVRGHPEVVRLFGLLHQARWPHVIVPFKYRIPLPILGMIFGIILLLSGVALLIGYGISSLIILKIVGFALVVGLQHLVMRKQKLWLYSISLTLLLVIVAASSLLLRA